jgi:mono/diheme cytochrome c family protein
MAGAWRAELIVRRAGYDDVRPTAELAIRDATPSGGVESAPPPAEGRLILGMEFLLLAAVAFGYAIWMAPGESQVLRLILPAAVAAVLAGSLMVGSGASALRLGWSVRNPIPPTPDSLARGRLVYTERCVLCHGEDGRGDGPGVPALSPPPPDFRLHLGAGHTDGEWFDWVSNGVPGTAMPGYRAELSTDDRWHVLNYLQQRFGSSPGLAPGF